MRQAFPIFSDIDHTIKHWAVLLRDLAERSLNPVITVEDNYKVAVTDKYIFVDATGGDVQVRLPPPNLSKHREYYIKKIDGSGNSVIVVSTHTNAAQEANIDGVSALSITTQYVTKQVVSDGRDYWTVTG